MLAKGELRKSILIDDVFANFQPHGLRPKEFTFKVNFGTCNTGHYSSDRNIQRIRDLLVRQTFKIELHQRGFEPVIEFIQNLLEIIFDLRPQKLTLRVFTVCQFVANRLKFNFRALLCFFYIF